MRFESEIFDRFQFLSETFKYNDHQLHCLIEFEDKISISVLEKAVYLTLNVIPILSTAYVSDGKRLYWESIDIGKFRDVLLYTNNKEVFDQFLTSRTDEFQGPQVRLCLLRNVKDSLAIIMNHMVCDGVGFKQYLYLLSDTYSKLISDTTYIPKDKLDGDRSLNQVLRQIKTRDKLKILTSKNVSSNKVNNFKYPMSDDETIAPFIEKRTLSRDKFIKLKRYCQENEVTVNDVVLAAYYRALYNRLGLKEDEMLQIAVMIDMRRYLKKKQSKSFCNLASSVVTEINYEKGDSLKRTVAKVNNEMKFKKDNYLGLKGFLEIALAFKVLSYGIIKKTMVKVFKNPIIGMTNIGVIDENKLFFKGSVVKQAFICGSIKYKPYFQVAVTTFKETMTLTINLYGSKRDEEEANNFLYLLEKELPL